MTRLLLITAILSACALPAVAQVAPRPLPGQPVTVPWSNAADQARYQADRHRYEMERLRLEADQRDTFARQQALESQLRVMQIQADRQPTPPQPWQPRATGTPEQARARRDAVVSGTTQIDDWLDRGPR